MKVNKVKKISMYQVDFDEITPDEKKTIADYGRQVITEDQYFEIGTIQALKNAIELNKVEKKKKRKRISKFL